MGLNIDTSIRWCDATWGFASGCEEIAPECAHCYARTIAESGFFRRSYPQGFGLTLRPHKLRDVTSMAHSGLLIFAGSMTDIGLPEIPAAYFTAILDAAEAARERDHRILFLTKRPALLAARLRRLGRTLSPHIWVGTTVGHTKGLRRVGELLEVPGGGVKFLSVEPLLEEPVADRLALGGIDWVIAGGESGSHYHWPEVMRRRARSWPPQDPAAVREEPWAKWWIAKHGSLPTSAGQIERMANTIEGRFMVHRCTRGGAFTPKPDRVLWARRLRDRCAAEGVAFFFKQWGGPKPDSAGHLLDGRAIEGFPVHALPEGWLERRRQADAEARRRLPLVG